jgi:hypothetical protein
MNTFIITNPSDIFTLIMNVYGTLEESIIFISDNSALIPCLATNIAAMAGQEVFYEPDLVVTYLAPKPVLSTPVAPVTEYTWMGREGQNMFDVCIQTYGILDELIKLMNDNNVDFSATVYLQQFNYDSTLIANSSTWNRSTGTGIIFSTGTDAATCSSFDEGFDIGSFDESMEYS